MSTADESLGSDVPVVRFVDDNTKETINITLVNDDTKEEECVCIVKLFHYVKITLVNWRFIFVSTFFSVFFTPRARWRSINDPLSASLPRARMPPLRRSPWSLPSGVRTARRRSPSSPSSRSASGASPLGPWRLRSIPWEAN